MTESMTGGAPLDAARARRLRADKISGLFLAATMALAFFLVLRTIIAIATGPVPASAGKDAPGFVTMTPERAPIGLGNYEHQVVLIDFWATWCPPCVASMPALQRLANEYRDKGFVVLGVNQEAGEEDTVRAFLKEHQITFPIAMDNGKIARDYGVFTFPTSFLISRKGEIHAVFRGVARESELRIEIEALLADPVPAPAERGAKL